jgi:DNA end-binding protein Ku
MMAIAEKIIEQQEGPFDPSQFNDRYEDALRALIKEKEKGARGQGDGRGAGDTNVVDLMEALRKSLGKGGASKPAAKKAPAKKPTPRKKSA